MDKQNDFRLDANISEQIRRMAEDEAKELQQYANKSGRRFILKTLVLLRNYLNGLICYWRKKWGMEQVNEFQCESM